MKAQTINLIPAARLQARQRRAHLRRCIIGSIAYTILNIAVVLTCRTLLGGADPSLAARLEEAQTAADRAARDLTSARTDLESAQSMLSASRSIVDQPDWGLLMKVLAAQQGSEIVLRDCRVMPVEAAAPAPQKQPGKRGAAQATPGEPAMVLSVTGLGRSQVAISQFVLRLEELHLFGKVVLLDTTRESFMGSEALGFAVDCPLNESTPQRPVVASAGGAP